MLATNALIELESIVDDIAMIIKALESRLDKLHRKEGSAKELKKAITDIAELKGIFTMLNMPGALALISETDTAVRQLAHLKSSAKVAYLFSIVSEALTILARYVEYISQRNASAPHLLLQTINRLRKLNNLSPHKESIFFVVPLGIQKLNLDLVNIENSDFGGSVLDLNLRKIRHLRQMFQIGLIEVILGSNLKGGCRMMRRSVSRMHQDFNGHSMPDLWVVAQSMLDGFINGGLLINNQRVKVLSLVDRQYRIIELATSNDLQSERNKSLLCEMLYLVSLSQLNNKQTLNLKKKYQLFNNRVDDSNFQHDLDVLRGPTPKDLLSLGEEILEELIRIEGHFKTTISKPTTDLVQLLPMVDGLSSLMLAVQFKEESLKLALVSAILQKASQQKVHLSQSDVNISLEVIHKLRSSFEKKDLSALSTAKKRGRSQLNNEQQAACFVASQHIKNAVKGFEQCYREKSCSELKTVAMELSQSKRGMEELKLQSLIGITDNCIELVQGCISSQFRKNTCDVSIQLLADAIGSIEFYLETLSKNRTPSTKVIEFARESIREFRAA